MFMPDFSRNMENLCDIIISYHPVLRNCRKEVFKVNLIRDREFSRKLLSLVIPLAFQQFMLQLVSASDAFMLGAVGQSELSAVSLAAQVQFVLGLFLAAVTIGTNIFAAQYWGKGDVESVEKFFAIAMRIAVPVSAFFTVCAASFPAAIMRLFTSDAVLIENGACYLRAASPSYLFCGISQVCFCIMKNSGQAGKSTVISSACVLFDILLNAVLISAWLAFPAWRSWEPRFPPPSQGEWRPVGCSLR